MVAPSTLAWAGCCVVGGTAGVPAVVGATKSWYRTIPLPSWTPPDRVFAPVWTTLYALMGVAAARVSRSGVGVTRCLLISVVPSLDFRSTWYLAPPPSMNMPFSYGSGRCSLDSTHPKARAM